MIPDYMTFYDHANRALLAEHFAYRCLMEEGNEWVTNMHDIRDIAIEHQDILEQAAATFDLEHPTLKERSLILTYLQRRIMAMDKMIRYAWRNKLHAATDIYHYQLQVLLHTYWDLEALAHTKERYR